MDYRLWIIIGGIALNLIMVLFYFILHKQIEKFESVEGKVLRKVKRSREHSRFSIKLD